MEFCFSACFLALENISDWSLEAKKLTNMLNFSPAAQCLGANSLYLNFLTADAQFCYRGISALQVIVIGISENLSKLSLNHTLNTQKALQRIFFRFSLNLAIFTFLENIKNLDLIWPIPANQEVF